MTEPLMTQSLHKNIVHAPICLFHVGKQHILKHNIKFILLPLRDRESLLTECMDPSKDMDVGATSLQTVFPSVFTFCPTATLPRHPCLIFQQHFVR